MSEPLKPCPFACDMRRLSVADVYPIESVHAFAVTCGICSCQGPIMLTKQQATEAWNRRADGTCRDCKFQERLVCDMGVQNIDNDFYCAYWETKDE